MAIKRLMAVACLQVMLGLGGAFAAVDEKAADVSGDEVTRKFESQKKFMVDDLAGKIVVMKEAKECAEAAVDVAALDACSAALREKILKRVSER